MAGLSERHRRILELAQRQDRVTVDDLSSHFGVSVQTIRKDLNELCDQRLLKRVHGGAELPSGIENLQYEQRRQIAAVEKDAIGHAAAALIPNDASLFINIGTTTEAVSQALLDHSGLLVVTNNINVANRMRVYPQFEVIIAGGVVRASDGGIVGEAAAAFFSQFKVDYAVIGASALDQDGALLDYDYREVKVAQAIIANARHVILVADAGKFARSAPVRIARLDQIGTFVTDRSPSAAFTALCAAAGVKLVEAGSDPAP
ncbi:DeoR faimly transcriptional regulator [Devosia limi DSM 17137]|uniref:DeoR faimly transcriptional regulator n=1 Tax=Devosia limi DSM 17137 TaxID=1121477 RepID=A0A0F5LYN7_9HYPH|nr:DeoR/GlpR family DNA-binding transcription regulator [Devosia limi]KKB86752.1 DeoR faimly transcriptional regulator [Devosia limi DSM 17137]SHF33364.1 transcriptional regulator, DeoR family [Devosia limi DSM 17137]